MYIRPMFLSHYVACAFVTCLIKNLLTYLLTYLLLHKGTFTPNRPTLRASLQLNATHPVWTNLKCYFLFVSSADSHFRSHTLDFVNAELFSDLLNTFTDNAKITNQRRTTASATTCVIALIRMYYHNVTVISLLLVIVCLNTCNHIVLSLLMHADYVWLIDK